MLAHPPYNPQQLFVKGKDTVFKPVPLLPAFYEDYQSLTVKPLLKWAGGKRWLVPHLRPLWKAHSQCRLVEPFCGGLAVTLGLQPKHAFLNDINPHIINFYNHVKGGLSITMTLSNNERVYYVYRKRFNQLITENRIETEEAAQLFYYLNRTGYNGLCRFNKKGEFNVPFGKYNTINYANDFYAYRTVFANWEFQTGDFQAIALEEGDFIYADPPYDVDFTQYSKEGFSWDDQVRLAEWLAQHRGPVVISNQATKRVIDLYSRLGFSLRFLDAPRMISCTGDRTRVTEVLALKEI